jgi:hypothetical protein
LEDVNIFDRPSRSEAVMAQNDRDAHETPSTPSRRERSSLVPFHAEAPPVGFLEVKTRIEPCPPRATQKDRDGHEMSRRP